MVSGRGETLTDVVEESLGEREGGVYTVIL